MDIIVSQIIVSINFTNRILFQIFNRRSFLLVISPILSLPIPSLVFAVQFDNCLIWQFIITIVRIGLLLARPKKNRRIDTTVKRGGNRKKTMKVLGVKFAPLNVPLNRRLEKLSLVIVKILFLTFPPIVSCRRPLLTLCNYHRPVVRPTGSTDYRSIGSIRTKLHQTSWHQFSTSHSYREKKAEPSPFSSLIHSCSKNAA